MASRPVDLDALAPLTSGIEEGDLDRVFGAGGDEAPDRRGGPVAQDGATAAAENRPRWRGQRRLESPDRVHAAMEAPQPPARHAGVDGVRSNTGIEELASGHDAVLAARQRDTASIDPRRCYVYLGTASNAEIHLKR